jgi:D-alanyl-D-alanine dipeptidase
LWDEYSALEIRMSEVWPELPAADVAKLGARLVDGSFFDGLDAAAKTGNTQAAQAATQIRRLLSHVVDIRTNGPRGA